MDSTTTLLVGYLSIEALFYVVFTFHLVPRANKRTEPHEYRDYGRHRHRLLLRILERMERTCRATNQNIRMALQDFMDQWFHHHPPVMEQQSSSSCPPPPLTRVSLSSSSSSPDTSSDEDDGEAKGWTMDGLGQQDADTFLSWAFFGKAFDDLDSAEHVEMDKIFGTLRERYNLSFTKGKSATKTARLLTLEDVNPLHRPLLWYAMVGTFQMLGGLALRVLGFRRFVTVTGLVYWFRGCPDSNRLPLLSFHGIAPGGLTPYLPMVLSGLGMADERACFLFENRNIANTLGFRALTEDETVGGVLEALKTHVDDPTVNVSLCGHSFGSCPMTWLLHSPLRTRIRQFVLLDPVTILLSEPDVMNNFLYSRQLQYACKGSKLEMLRHSMTRTKIRVLASSELFTEYYLRRHFSWYNSELWLDDIPKDVQVVVCLAEKDEIINAPKVKREVTLYNEHHSSCIKLVYWEGAGHARCVTSVRKWAQLRNVMLEQEAVIHKMKSM